MRALKIRDKRFTWQQNRPPLTPPRTTFSQQHSRHQPLNPKTLPWPSMISSVDRPYQRLTGHSEHQPQKALAMRRTGLNPDLAALASSGNGLDHRPIASRQLASAPAHAADGGSSCAGAGKSRPDAPTMRSQISGTRAAARSGLNQPCAAWRRRPSGSIQCSSTSR